MAERTNLELEAPSVTDAPRGVAPAPGGFKTFLPLIMTIILMPMVAWAMTTYILVPQLQKSLSSPSEHAGEKNGKGETEHGGKSAAEKGAAKETVMMTKLLVNVSGTMGSRYLLTSLTLAGGGVDFKTRIEKNDPKLRDVACTVLAGKTITDLEKPGSRNLVRSELLTAFNNILGANTVQEIYLTEFAIQ